MVSADLDENERDYYVAVELVDVAGDTAMGRKYRFKLLEKEVAQVNKILESGVTFSFDDPKSI